MNEKTHLIREQNDQMRQGDSSIPGQLIFTTGLRRHLEESDQTPEDIIAIVAAFDDFTQDNDPHGEHDFGMFDCCGEKVYWKIDYYDDAILYGSNDPSDLTKTMRMLTVFLASEY